VEKLKLSSDGGGSGSKKCKGGCGGFDCNLLKIVLMILVLGYVHIARRSRFLGFILLSCKDMNT
jgi:hypothetical protein